MTALLFMFLQMTLLKDAIEISFYYRRTVGKTSEKSLCSCVARRPPVFLRRTQKEGDEAALLSATATTALRHFTNG